MESLIKRIWKGCCRRISWFLAQIPSLVLLPKVFRQFREIRKIAKENAGVSIMAMTEHIGDIVVSEPIIRFLSEERNRKVIWIVNKKYSELLKYNPNVYASIEVSILSEWIYLKRLLIGFTSLPIHDLHFNKRFCPKYKMMTKNKVRPDITFSNYYNQGPLIAPFCLVGGIPLQTASPRFYMPPKEWQSDLGLPEKYIAIQTTSSETPRDWDLEKWGALIDHFHEYTFIELGIKPTLHRANCISSYCGKITLLEAAQIIENCRLFIGIDSGFAHFANAFAKPAVILLGKFFTYDYYMPYSGNFENPDIATVIHHSDIVNKLPLDEVIRAVETRIVKCGMSEDTK